MLVVSFVKYYSLKKPESENHKHHCISIATFVGVDVKNNIRLKERSPLENSE